MRVFVFVTGAFVTGNREDSSPLIEFLKQPRGPVGPSDPSSATDTTVCTAMTPTFSGSRSPAGQMFQVVMVWLCVGYSIGRRRRATAAPDEERRRFLTLPAGRSGRLRHQRGVARHPYGFHVGALARSAASSRRRMSSGPSVDAPPSRYMRGVICADLAEAVSRRNDEAGRDVRGAGVRQDQAAAQGSTTSMSTSSKSRTLRVATAMRGSGDCRNLTVGGRALRRIAPA